MSQKILSAQAPFTMVAPNLAGGSDPSLGEAGNPTVLRSRFTQQYIVEIAGKGGPNIVTGNPKGPTTICGGMLTTGGSTGATGTVEVADATNMLIRGGVTLILGQYRLVAGVDFVVATGSKNDTATKLAEAINALPGYTAPAPGGATVSVTGPVGPAGNMAEFRATGGAAYSLTLTPSTGTLSGGTPTIGAMTIE